MRVSLLKIKYQRNLLIGMLVNALICAGLASFFLLRSPEETVLISAAQIQIISHDLRIDSTAYRTGAGHLDYQSRGKRGYNAGQNLAKGFKVVNQVRLPVPVAIKSILSEHEPNEWIDSAAALSVKGPDDFEELSGSLEGDGWPIANNSEQSPLNTNGIITRALKNYLFARQFIKPLLNKPAYIIWHSVKWPDKARWAGIDSAIVVARIIISPNGGILDNGGKFNCIIISEDPPGYGFRESFMQMLREGSFFSAEHQGQKIASTIEIKHYFCLRCPQFSRTTGNVVVSFSK